MNGRMRYVLGRNIDTLIAAAVGYFIICLYTLHSGIGISPDSVTYLSVARNIHTHGAFVSFSGRPVVDFPLFYPVWLSLFIFLTHSDPMAFAPVLNGLMFAALIWLSGRMMEGFIYPSRWYKRIILSFLVLSPGLLEVYSMMWSETLFLLLVLLFMIALRKYFLARRLSTLMAAAAIAAFACVTRYTGVTLVATGGLLLLLHPGISFRKRTLHLLIFGSIALSLLAVNLAYNLIERGMLTGPREAGIIPLFTNIGYFGSVLCDWLPVFTEEPAIAVALAAVIILLVVFCRRYAQGIHLQTYEHIATAFFLVYAFFMVAIATISRFEELNSRLLSPLFIPLLWSGTYGIPHFIKKFSRRRRIAVLTVCLLLAAAFQVNQLMADYDNYDGIKDAGVPGYTEDDWQYSPTVNFIKKNEPMLLHAGAVYSDADDAIWFFTGIRTKLLPHRENPREVKTLFGEKDFMIVWFDDAADPDLLSLEDIEARRKIRLLHKFDDGAIYVSDSSAAVSPRISK